MANGVIAALVLGSLLVLVVSYVSISTSPASSSQKSKRDAANCSINSGDVALVFFATCFVMLQTPAMGIAQAGLLRRKNSLSMLMQVLTGMVLLSLVWWVCGFSFVFGPTAGGFIGNPATHFMLLDVSFDACLSTYPGADSIPALLFAVFQMTFFIMAPLIISGSWAEKMKFSAFIIFILLFSFLVYMPVAHWVWNPEGFLAAWGLEDYSGGLVIHTATGVSGFIVSLFLYKRRNVGKTDPHSVPLFILGASLIWVGWYSFNAGSAYKANGLAVRALVNTHLSACAGAVVFVIFSYGRDRHFHLLEIMNGSLAGLAGITAGSGYVSPWSAVVIGAIAGIVSYFSMYVFRRRWMLDDVLDVSSLQGAPGIVGTLLTGVFANHVGLVYGNGFKQLGVQLVGILVVSLWTALFTYVILVLIRRTVGTDVSVVEEELGLDISQLGERAYDIDLGLLESIGADALISRLLDAAASGDLQELKSLVRAGADVGAPDYDNRTALHLAAAEGHDAVVSYLLKHQDTEVNAVDNWKRTALHEAVRSRRDAVIDRLRGFGARIVASSALEDVLYACSSGDVDTIRYYERAGLSWNRIRDYDLRSPLHVAVSANHEEIVAILRDAGCDMEARDRWNNTPKQYDTHNVLHRSEFAAPSNSNASPDVEEVLMPKISQQQQQQTIHLCAAAFSGDLEQVDGLLRKGSDCNATDYDGRSALLIAAGAGHLQIVRRLMQEPSLHVELQDRNKETALSEATQRGHWRICELLREAGATHTGVVGFKLCRAAALGDLEALRTMQRSGIDVNTGDYDQRNALMLAAAEGQAPVVRWLLANGASKNLKDSFGNTAIDGARDPEIRALLSEAE